MTMTVDASHTTILKLLARGRDPEWVAQATDRHPTEVEEIGRRYGWPDLVQLRANLDGAGVVDDRPRHQPAPQRPPAQQQPRPTPTAGIAAAPGTGKLEFLLARAGRHDTAPVRAARNAVLTACTRLEGALQKAETKARERNERDAAKAAAKARVETLERQLREARAALRGKPAPAARATTAAKPVASLDDAEARRRQKLSEAGKKRMAQQNALDPAIVRAWARENDVECPARGRFLPKAVIDAYLSAHPEEATA